MSPEREVDEVESDRDAQDVGRDADGVNATSAKPAAKRRTKTGCLTCRKRRIKCGEERPSCKNCVKSKRECAGYVQPLVYRQHNQGSPPLIQDANGSAAFAQHPDFAYPAYPTSGGSPNYYDPNYYGTSQPGSVPQSQHGYAMAFTSSQHQPLVYGNGSIGHPQAMPLDAAFSSQRRHSAHLPPSSFGYDRADMQVRVPGRTQSWATDVHGYSSSGLPYPSGSGVNPSVHHSIPIDPNLQTHSGYATNPPAHNSSALPGEPLRRYSVHGFVQPTTNLPPIPILANPTVEPLPEEEQFEDPEDPFDVIMEEDYDITVSSQDDEDNLAAMLDRQETWVAPLEPPRKTSRQQSRGIQTYKPSVMVSPLQEERNERIFCHFVEVTSKCMSIFERQPISTVARATGSLWGFKLPAMALSHPALAHALLALGSIHIAKLQNTSEDPALKHFTYAVRRVGKLLGLPARRHEIATLAAVLVLGFYEVIGADHSRWNLHLAGAMKLVMEHDCAGMTKAVRRLRRVAKQNISIWSTQQKITTENYVQIAGIPEPLLDDSEWDIDQKLVSSLTGFEIDYDRHTQPALEEISEDENLTEKDISDFKIKMDLRWWCCKQDIFQSVISGDELLLPYEHWKYCPPRGQIGNASIPYGTFDHLVLILGRLADFGGKDRARKQRVVEAQGGVWRPPPGFFPPSGPPGMPGRLSAPPGDPRSEGKVDSTHKASPAPSANEGRVRQSKPPSGLPPQMGNVPMYGMVPPPDAPVKMHSAFEFMDASIRDKAFSKPSDVKVESHTTPDLEAETAKALEQHAAITRAFDLFAQSLGPDFDPLPSDGKPPVTTPFGPPLIYRSHQIACIWGHYLVGRMLLHRYHPHMPPAAMVAAGVTAHLTQQYAQTIGKLCAGLYCSDIAKPGRPLDPAFAGVLMESTFPLLFGGIQYVDMAQRGWTMSKLQDIARMTGWHTAGSMAAACEMAWEKLGQAGRGPPYTRTLDRNNKDSRINGQSRRGFADLPNESSKSNAHEQHESQFVRHDRNLIDKHGPARVHWALGLLSVEEDIKKLDISGS